MSDWNTSPENEVAKGNSRDPGDGTNVPAIALFGVGLLMLLGLAFVLTHWFFAYLAAGPPRKVAGADELLQARRLPPPPRLEPEPTEELRELRAAEDSLLGSYGWVDRKAGIARIPIDRSIELTAERGLPARKERREGP